MSFPAWLKIDSMTPRFSNVSKLMTSMPVKSEMKNSSSDNSFLSFLSIKRLVPFSLSAWFLSSIPSTFNSIIFFCIETDSIALEVLSLPIYISFKSKKRSESSV